MNSHFQRVDNHFQRVDKYFQRIDYIDTVRGFAAVFVLWSHFNLGFGLPQFVIQYSNTPLHLLWDGFAGVSMFFVLSGFVLSLKYFNSIEFDSNGIPNFFNEILRFYIKRICRICLPFVFVLILSFLAYKYLYQIYPTDPNRSEWIYSLWKDPFKPHTLPIFLNTLPTFLNTLLIVIQQSILILPGTTHTIVPQAWSLTLEMQLSFMMPFLIFAANRNLTILTSIVIMCSIIDLMVDSLRGTQTSMFFAALFHFYIGILLSKYYRQLNIFICESHLVVKSTLIVVGLLLYSFRITIFPRCSEIFPVHSIPYLNALGSFLILLSIMGLKHIQNFLNIPFFHFIGKVSYSLYLSHILVLIIIVPLFIKWINTNQINGCVSQTVALVFATLISFMIATIFYYCVEKPSIKFGSFIVNKFSNNS